MKDDTKKNVPLDKEEKSQIENIDVIFKMVLSQKQYQLDSWKSIDTKAGIILGFILLLVTTTLFSSIHQMLKLLLIVPLLVSSISTIASLFPRDFYNSPNPSVLLEKYKDEPKLKTILQLCSNISGDFDRTYQNQTIKQGYLKLSYIFLIVYVIFVTIIVCL